MKLSDPASSVMNPRPQDASDQDRSSFEPVGNFFWDLFKILMLALVIIMPIRFFLIQPFIVSGNSMEPNYSHGDYLVIDEISYRFAEPRRGDVVVLRYPQDPSQFFIKRIVGLPGERVMISGGRVRVVPVNSQAPVTLDEDYLPPGTDTKGEQSLLLGKGQYFVLGDNRSASSDSRSWGVLPYKDIIGKTWVRVFPLSDFLFFQQPHYAT